MKLEVGMYVRFLRANETYIRKITSRYRKTIQNQTILIFDKPFRYSCWSTAEKNVLKASHNIIDLIEVGDVIIDKEGHKYPINYEFETDYNNEYGSYEITIDDHITLFLKDGLSIVTKEQMEAVQYKVV